ncbi:MAG: phosphomannomutase/phosphoglucomutase [Planctomycetes bacterium]|nr:phosphomannomutase/phosphoglucomutase [Planctomycetota bacterium]
MSIFKPCDLRGVYGDDLTDDIMKRVGQAMATLLIRDGGRPSPTILVAGDLRTSTPALKEGLVGGMAAGGAKVVDIGIVPTPLFYFAFAKLHSDACATVTASHNPPQFNGLKLCLSSMPVRPDQIDRLAEIVASGDFETGKGSVRREDFRQRYGQFIRDQFRDRMPLCVAVDCGNGGYSAIAPQIMAGLGIDVIPLFCEPDGRFPNRSPDPTRDALEALCTAVRSKRADYGMAFDGDGDRVVFVDNRGRKVNVDKAIVLLGRHTLATQARPGVREKVVYEVNCSRIVPEQIEARGGEPLLEKAGHAFIKTRMLAEDALYGGEISGHFFYRALHGGDDGFYSGLLMGQMLLREGRSLSELADDVPSYHISPKLRMPCDNRKAAEIVERIAAGAGRDQRVRRVDGVRIDYADGWGLARVSVTEPVLSLRFEAVREGLMEGLARRFLRPTPEVLDFVLQELS